MYSPQTVTVSFNFSVSDFILLKTGLVILTQPCCRAFTSFEKVIQPLLVFLPYTDIYMVQGAQISPVNLYPKILAQNKFNLDTGDAKCPKRTHIFNLTLPRCFTYDLQYVDNFRALCSLFLRVS